MQSMVGGVMASISIVLIINFVKVYTKGITDIDYVDFIAAFLFSFNLMLECSRGASLASANIAGKAPETTWRYILEAAINLISSLVLVRFIGMKGVLLGTSLAGLYRTTDSILYTNRHVLQRSSIGEFKNVWIDFLIYFSIAFMSAKVLKINATSYVQLLGIAVVTGVIIVLLYLITFIIFNRKEAANLIIALKKR